MWFRYEIQDTRYFVRIPNYRMLLCPFSLLFSRLDLFPLATWMMCVVPLHILFFLFFHSCGRYGSSPFIRTRTVSTQKRLGVTNSRLPYTEYVGTPSYNPPSPQNASGDTVEIFNLLGRTTLYMLAQKSKTTEFNLLYMTGRHSLTKIC